MARRRAQLESASDRHRMELNAWNMTSLADPNAPVVLRDFLRERGIESIDFIKIDIDGDDFDVLQTFDGSFRTLGVLGVAAEVNFVGGVEAHEHTFHNTDRFMRRNGFDLFSLTTRPYANAMLPSRYQLSIPAQTLTGRPLQGDAIYVRDVFQEDDDPGLLSVEKLLKVAAIYSLMGLPDMAAEVVVKTKDRLSRHIDARAALDALAAQTQAPVLAKGRGPLSYADYMAAFARDDASFYPR